MRLPAEIYSRSPRLYSGLPELDYPFHDRTVTVTRCGRICLGAMKINLSQAFAGQKVGVKQVEEKIWLVSFMRYELRLLQPRDMPDRERGESLQC